MSSIMCVIFECTASLSRSVLEPPRSSDCTSVSASSSLPSCGTLPQLALEDISQSSPPRTGPDNDPISTKRLYETSSPGTAFTLCVLQVRAPCPIHRVCFGSSKCPIVTTTQCGSHHKKASHRRQFHRFRAWVSINASNSSSASLWVNGCSCFCASLTK